MKTGIEYLHDGYTRNIVAYDANDHYDIKNNLVRIAKNIMMNQGMDTDLVKIISPIHVTYDKVFVRIDTSISEYYKTALEGHLPPDKEEIVIFVNDADEALLGAI